METYYGIQSPAGFTACPFAPLDSQQTAGPVDAGDGWSLTTFVDSKTGIHYLEYYKEGVDWFTFCGIPGQHVDPVDLIEMTNLQWEAAPRRTWMWAALGAFTGAVGGLVIAKGTGGDKALYGALGAGGGAALGALVLATAIRPSGYAQTAGMGLIDVRRDQIGWVRPTQVTPAQQKHRVAVAKKLRSFAQSQGWVAGTNPPPGTGLCHDCIWRLGRSASRLISAPQDPSLWVDLCWSWSIVQDYCHGMRLPKVTCA